MHHNCGDIGSNFFSQASGNLINKCGCLARVMHVINAKLHSLPPGEGRGFFTEGLQKTYPCGQSFWIIPRKPTTILPVYTSGEEQIYIYITKINC